MRDKSDTKEIKNGQSKITFHDKIGKNKKILRIT